jgi:hypothetical protein
VTPAGHHLSAAVLLDYARGLLASSGAHAAEAHLAQCARCATEAAATRRIFDLARMDKLEDAPAHVLNRAIRLFHQGQRRAPRPSALERLISVLHFDSAQAPLAPGVRSGAAVPRQMVYAAGEYTVEIRILTRGSMFRLAGQVLGPCNGGRVMVTGPLGDTDAELSEMCEFEMGPLPNGTYQMTVRLAEVEIDVPDVELG